MATPSWWVVPESDKLEWRGTPVPLLPSCSIQSKNAMLPTLSRQKTHQTMENAGTSQPLITPLTSALHGSIRVSPNWEAIPSGASLPATGEVDMWFTWAPTLRMQPGSSFIVLEFQLYSHLQLLSSYFILLLTRIQSSLITWFSKMELSALTWIPELHKQVWQNHKNEKMRKNFLPVSIMLFPLGHITVLCLV